jgi:LysR family transcriptional activator of mexEF-oprN operon
MNEIDLRRLDLNLLVTFDVLMAERHVTRAAQRLGRTQSAVSHSLARLREQVGDPLLVKVGGRMTPSPFAERLIEDVRPILRSIRRVLAPPSPFVPATSTRTFRIAISTVAPSLIPRLMARLQREAPGVKLEWTAEGPQTPIAVAEGQVDIAFLASTVALPDGLDRDEAIALEWSTFARKDHPGLASWGMAAWRKWPHLVVQIDNSVPSPVSEASVESARKRVIAARVPNFSCVAPMLAHTDLLATLPAIVMDGTLETYGLRALRPPFPLQSFPHRFVWSSRLANDPALRWLRERLAQCFAEVLKGSRRAGR